jgi:hypothetical protein
MTAAEDRPKVGDRVDTIDGRFRGKITRLDETAEKWAYTVQSPTGQEELFGSWELRKVEPVEELKLASTTLGPLHVLIGQKQAELDILLAARDVLERVLDA